MIWRDDDIGVQTRVWQLRHVNNILRSYGQAHTIAIVACGLDTRPDLVDLIRERQMIPQLHCWRHDDLTVDEHARDSLERACDLIERLTEHRPTVLYPPWNRTSPDVEAVAARLGLTVKEKKISLEQYIRCAGDVAEDTINFHHWHSPDVDLLQPALAIDARASLASQR